MTSRRSLNGSTPASHAGSTCSTPAMRSGPSAGRRGSHAVCLADLGYAHLDQEEVHESQIPGVLEALAHLQQEFEGSGQFREAELVRARLQRLRDQEEGRIHEEYQSRQIAERLGVEEAHMQELEEFNENWDRKDTEFEMHVASLHQTLHERHQRAHSAYLEKIDKETEPRHPKWSKELLNLKKISETLAKQKNYVEAAKVKDEIDSIESKEYAMWKGKREAKLAGLEEQFLTKQQLEMAGLMSRIDANRSEHKQAKKKELQLVLQRYHNVKTQMESQQKIKYQRASQHGELDLETASTSSRPSLIHGSRKSAISSRASLAGSSLDGRASLSGSTGENTRASIGGASQRPSTAGSARSGASGGTFPRSEQRPSSTGRVSRTAEAAGKRNSGAASASAPFAPPRRHSSLTARESLKGAPAEVVRRPSMPTWK